MDDPEEIYSAEQIAEIMQVDYRTVLKWMERGLPYLDIAPRVKRITKSTLNKLKAGEYRDILQVRHDGG